MSANLLNKDYDLPLPKNIVMCLDGTNCEFGPKPFTNVLRIYRLLEKDSRSQLCYYQPGIGATPRTTNNVFAIANESWDSLVANSMRSHILEAYTFLTRFYEPGDKIFLYGFSRGAFTARALAGMLEKVGLLKPGNENLVNLAYECYISWEYNIESDPNGPKNTLVNEFKRTFSRKSVKVHFMGLWDSVNSVGLIRDRMFPLTSRTSNVHHVRHAVSIDERRGKFKQCLFVPYSYCPASIFSVSTKPYIDVGDDCFYNVELPRRHSEPAISPIDERTPLLKKTSTSLNNLPSSSGSNGNSEDLVEKWFCGDHCDVGGGWYPLSDGTNLSNVSFDWIVGESYAFGINFKREEIKRYIKNSGIQKDSLTCHHDVLTFKMPPWLRSSIDYVKKKWFNHPEESTHEECCEAANHSSFLASFLWWSGEVLPFGFNIEDNKGHWKSYYMPNLGRPRKIPRNADFHWSVYYRLKMDKNYRPKNLPFDIEETLNEIITAGVVRNDLQNLLENENIK